MKPATDWRDFGYPEPGTEYDRHLDGCDDEGEPHWHRRPRQPDDEQLNMPSGAC